MTLSVHAYWLWHWKISVNVTSKTINITDKSYNVSGWDQTCICGVMFSVLTSSVLDLSASRVKPKSRLNKNWYLLHLWNFIVFGLTWSGLKLTIYRLNKYVKQNKRYINITKISDTLSHWFITLYFWLLYCVCFISLGKVIYS